jgi:endonuclease/exonuclease/phosphatase family metal-dependent hydrolase
MLFILLLFSLLQIIKSDPECPYITSNQDRRQNKSSLVIAQYNAEWLFIDHDSQFDCPGSQCPWHNTTAAEIHMSYVAKAIHEINPDIINICEVEGCDELNLLADQLDGTYKSYLKQGTDTSTGQNVGLLTRVDPKVSLYRTEEKMSYPIQGSKCGYTGSPGSTGVSKHYITEFTFSNKNMALIAAHLIAYPTDSSRCAQREAQASILNKVILGYIQKGYSVIMMGDFNDFDGKVLDVNSNKPTSQVLDILKGNTFGNYQLFSAAQKMAQSDRFSDWYDSDNNCNTGSSKDYSMIDHILVTEDLLDSIFDVYMYHGYPEYCGKYDSDHYPVVIEIHL